MTVFQYDLEKLYEGEYFTNRYFINAATIDDAANYGNTTILAAERSILHHLVQVTKSRTSTVMPNDGTFITTAIEMAGEVNSGTLVPLFNVAVVLFNTLHGRPYRKLYRGVLTEEGTSWGSLTGPYYDLLMGALPGLIVPDGSDQAVCTKDGVTFTTVVAQSKVGMRQLRRGSKRKSTPVLP